MRSWGARWLRSAVATWGPVSLNGLRASSESLIGKTIALPIILNADTGNRVREIFHPSVFVEVFLWPATCSVIDCAGHMPGDRCLGIGPVIGDKSLVWHRQ
jgi:hypothetical protein